MYSYFLDPPHPNFKLSFVKIGMSMTSAVLIKFSHTESSFITYIIIKYNFSNQCKKARIWETPTISTSADNRIYAAA